MSTLGYRYFTKPKWQLDTLDVGQGLATLIVKEGKGVLYDTGPSLAEWNRGLFHGGIGNIALSSTGKGLNLKP